MRFLVGGALAIGGASVATVATGAGIGAMVGSSLMGAFGAQTEDELIEQRKYAAEMYGEQRGLLREQKGLAGETAELGYDVAQSQFAGGRRDVSMGTQTGMRDIQAGGDIAMAQSGLATSGTVEQKVKTQTGDLMAKYKNDMTKLFETRELAGQQKDIARSQAAINFSKGEISAEEAEAASFACMDEGGFWSGAIEGGLGAASTVV